MASGEGSNGNGGCGSSCFLHCQEADWLVQIIMLHPDLKRFHGARYNARDVVNHLHADILNKDAVKSSSMQSCNNFVRKENNVMITGIVMSFFWRGIKAKPCRNYRV